MRFRRYALLVVTALLAALLVCVFAVKYKAAKAQRLLEIVASLRMGERFDLSDSRLEQFKRYKVLDAPYCSGNTAVSYYLYNSWLVKLHLAPGNLIEISLVTHNGVLIHRSVSVLGEPRHGASVIQGQSDACGNGLPTGLHHREILRSNYSPSFSVVRIYEDETTSAAQLKADWNIDLSCFGSMQACSHPERVLKNALAFTGR